MKPRALALLSVCVVTNAWALRCGGHADAPAPAEAGADGAASDAGDLDASDADPNQLCQQADAVCLGPFAPLEECGEFLFNCSAMGQNGSCCYPSPCFLAGGSCGYMGCPGGVLLNAQCPQGSCCSKK